MKNRRRVRLIQIVVDSHTGILYGLGEDSVIHRFESNEDGSVDASTLDPNELREGDEG
jgi:hypothetical protein